MTDIFVSYASNERERLRPLVEALEAQGWKVWWDKRFLSGNRIGEIIAAKLDEARCVIVAWTKLSANSDWVAGEADHAKEAGKLLPIRLDGKSDVPLNFRGVFTEDFSKWTGDRNAPEFIQLCDAIRDKLNGPVAPPDATTAPKIDVLAPPRVTPSIASGGRPKLIAAAAAVFIFASAGVGAWWFYPPPPNTTISDDEWKRRPDRGYCFQRDFRVPDGQYIARCFQTSSLCEAWRGQDRGKVTSCLWTTGLLGSPAWNGATPGGISNSWSKYSESTKFPQPFPQF